jgi:radical SAM superfamily enzyme with C-terminal helix-hairpin-helix motif
MRAAVCVCVAGIAAVLGGCAVRARQLDLNSASPTQLEKLPGIGREEAERIVAGRPYASKDDLLRRHVVSRGEYDAIAEDLYVGPPGIPDYLRSVPPMPEGP